MLINTKNWANTNKCECLRKKGYGKNIEMAVSITNLAELLDLINNVYIHRKIKFSK